MAAFVIAKASRSPHRDGYQGPACDDAQIPPGKIYTSRLEAEQDAEKLAAVNPVGFLVHPRPEKPA